jgi:radical S-adenosyl methionine domain-containing protein 2
MQANAPKPHKDLLAAFIACEDIEKSGEPQQVIFVEDNDTMTESYLMVSPDGRLFQNGSEEYTYSRPLTEVSFADALSDIKFDSEKFESRYATWPTQNAVNEMEYFFHLVEDNYDDCDCYMEFSDN